jgi:single-strand DNA-binding protein
MASINRVFLMGNLTRDPELRYTPGGSAVTEIGLAVNRRYKAQSGEMQEETTFVDITVWGRQAENVNQYLSKGRPVFVEGRLQLDSWETQDGQKRSKLKVVADNVQFLGSRSDGGGGQGGGSQGGGGQRGGQGGGGRDYGQGQRGQGQQDQRQSPPPSTPRPQEPPTQQPPSDDDLNLDDIPF